MNLVLSASLFQDASDRSAFAQVPAQTWDRNWKLAQPGLGKSVGGQSLIPGPLSHTVAPELINS